MKTRFALALTITLGIGLLLIATASAQEGDPERGRGIYVENCMVCHGLEAKGRIGANLTDFFPSIDPNSFIEDIVTNGIPGSVMPAWGEANGGPLTEQDIADVKVYILELAGGYIVPLPAPTIVPPAIEPIPEVAGDPSQGAVVFANNCAVCHGERGEGRIGATLVKAWTSAEPAAYVRTVVEDGVEGAAMPPWLDENGGPLTADEIEDVAAYVLYLGQTEGESGTGATGPEVVRPGIIGLGAGLIGLAVFVALAILVGVWYYRKA